MASKIGRTGFRVSISSVTWCKKKVGVWVSVYQAKDIASINDRMKMEVLKDTFSKYKL